MSCSPTALVVLIPCQHILTSLHDLGKPRSFETRYREHLESIEKIKPQAKIMIISILPRLHNKFNEAIKTFRKICGKKSGDGRHLGRGTGDAQEGQRSFWGHLEQATVLLGTSRARSNNHGDTQDEQQ